MGGDQRAYVRPWNYDRRTLTLRPTIFSDNFDDYWRVASKVTPTTIPTRSQSPPPSAGTLHTRPPSVDPGTTASGPDKDSASSVRSVPIRIYLPDGPVLQELAPPMLDGGQYSICYRSSPIDSRNRAAAYRLAFPHKHFTATVSRSGKATRVRDCPGCRVPS